MKLSNVTGVSAAGVLESCFFTPEYGEGNFYVAPGSPLLVNALLSTLPNGDAVLVGDWTQPTPGMWNIPADLVASVRQALALERIQ